MTNHIKSFQFFWWLVTASLSFRSGTGSISVLALPPCHPVIKLHDNLQTQILKRGPIKIKTQPRNKSDSFGSESWIQCKWNYRRNSWYGDVDSALVLRLWICSKMISWKHFLKNVSIFLFYYILKISNILWKLYHIYLFLATKYTLWDLINNSLARDWTPGPSSESIES